MGDEIGPFHVEASQIKVLGRNFAGFVTELLRCESTVNGQLAKIAVTENETAPDGGVDVLIEDYTGTSEWIPPGSSVWQLKSADYEPADIRNEFTRASYARGKVEAGAVYVLLLAIDLPAKSVETRRKALLDVAKECEYITTDEDEKRFILLTAANIASWASKYPALALSPVLGGRGSLGIDFNAWSSRDMYSTKWLADNKRELAISSINSQLNEGTTPTITVTGPSGVGKTRLVLEALRNTAAEPFVVYVFASDLTSEFLNHLVDRVRNRRAILVVDDCTAGTRKKVEAAIQSGSGVKAIIIETADDPAVLNKVIPVDLMQREHVEKILENNDLLWREARTFVVEHCAGNIKYALWIGNMIAEQPGGSLSNILKKDLIYQLIGGQLPDGQELLAACLLALLPRVGWDEELETEVQLLSSCFSIPMGVFVNVEIKLRELGILEKEGRYRRVTPHPVACYLASKAWQMHAEAIRRDLMPTLTGKMELGFYERMADLGHRDETNKTIEALLIGDPSFSSLAAIETAGKSDLLSRMAIVAPELVLEHVTLLIHAVPASVLKDMKVVRRGLVYTLTKLVWNSRTFVSSADNLLLLALSENESWANNASGTWTGLFASVLPSTSASPTDRANYLLDKSESADLDVLLLTVIAARKGLDPFESSMADGELQSGVVVEPRGMPHTYADLYTYQSTMIDVLRCLAKHTDPKVAAAAQGGLVEAIHSSLAVEVVRTALADAIVAIDSDDLLRSTRIEIRHLESLFGSREDTFAVRIAGLENFQTRLPRLSDFEGLMVLARSRSWDFDDGVLCAELRKGFGELLEVERLVFLDQAFSVPRLPAAFELGRALAELQFDLLAEVDLLDKILVDNLLGLTGFLMKCVEDGDISAFDDFFSQTYASTLSRQVQYCVLMMAPVTEVSWEKASELIRSLSPGYVAANGVPWLQKMSEEQMSLRLGDLVARVIALADQSDYNEVLDYASLSLYGKTDVSEAMQDLLWHLVELRRELPDVGGRDWAWSRISGFLVTNYGESLSLLILDLIDLGVIQPHREEEEVKLLKKCLAHQPGVVFDQIATRLVANDWRVSWAVRDWMSRAVPTKVMTDWIAGDVTRAQIIATVCDVGVAEPSDLAVFLLSAFPGDESIESELFSTFYSGSWSGKNSDRLQTKIDQLKEWLAITEINAQVADWASKAIKSLKSERQRELDREEERLY